MFARRRPTIASSTVGLAIVAALAAVPTIASAQGLFDFLFGARRHSGPPPSANAYADPFPNFSPRLNDPERRAGPSGPASAYCVRLCDGRYFPMQRNAGASPAQLCSSFCPAAETKVFSGGGIDHAVASDGTRYANLRNAFAYRERTVENCTCNGRDAYGLVTLNASSDPTLRHGDIVATNEGFVAYSGGGRRQAGEFTPIASYPGLSAEWRERLAQTKIEPRNATPVSPDRIRDGASLIYDERGRRVQLSR